MTASPPPQPVEPELSPEVAERTSGLRTGWTTGTCASAAAKAAAIGLCTGVRPDLASFVEAALAGGVDIVQLREKSLEAGPELAALGVIANGITGVITNGKGLLLHA